jgi:NAD+ synthase (glutamine-hydrolysing)
MKVNIALAQINTHLGNVQWNLEKHLDLIHQATSAGSQLIVFPELSLTGYCLQDLASNVAHEASVDDPIFKPLLEASQRIDMVVGFVEEDPRHRFHIASAYLSSGQVVHTHYKAYLPTYGLFDEGRFFAPGNAVRAFDTRFGRAGILICEDFWHASPPYLLWMDGADLFILTSASPGRGLGRQPALESARWVEDINRGYANLFTSYVVHANRAGYEDGLNFWGGSTIFNPNGELIAKGSYHEEELVMAEIDLEQLHRTRSRLPLLRDERPMLTLSELQRILQCKQSS